MKAQFIYCGKNILHFIPLLHLLQKLPNLPSIRNLFIRQLKLLKLMPLMVHSRVIGRGMESGQPPLIREDRALRNDPFGSF